MAFEAKWHQVNVPQFLSNPVADGEHVFSLLQHHQLSLQSYTPQYVPASAKSSPGGSNICPVFYPPTRPPLLSHRRVHIFRLRKIFSTAGSIVSGCGKYFLSPGPYFQVAENIFPPRIHIFKLRKIFPTAGSIFSGCGKYFLAPGPYFQVAENIFSPRVHIFGLWKIFSPFQYFMAVAIVGHKHIANGKSLAY